MSRYTLLTSILLTRATGVALSVGLILLVYWLVAVASGSSAYHDARAVLSLGVLKAVYLILLAAFSCHFFAGIRHLIWDTGHGIEREQAKRSSLLLVVVSIVVFVGLAWWALHAGGHAP
jgi:succinate dehydrogenase / fumarate reductase cytochrome b subunit